MVCQICGQHVQFFWLVTPPSIHSAFFPPRISVFECLQKLHQSGHWTFLSTTISRNKLLAVPEVWKYVSVCLPICPVHLSVHLSIFYLLSAILLSSDAIDLSICPSMSICIYSYIQVKPARGGWRKFPGLLHYRIQRRGLPIGDAAKFHSFSTLLKTSHFLAPLLSDPHLCAPHLESPQLSFHLSSLFSARLDSSHLSSTRSILSQPGWSDTSANLFNCLSLRSIRLARSSCVRLITRELQLGCNYP